MYYCMDQTAASKDEKACTDKKNPAALNLVAGYLKAAGPECPHCDKQTDESDKDFLTNMVIKQEAS